MFMKKLWAVGIKALAIAGVLACSASLVSSVGCCKMGMCKNCSKCCKDGCSKCCPEKSGTSTSKPTK